MRTVAVGEPEVVVLDNDVLSDILKADNPRAAVYEPHVRGRRPVVPAMVIAEQFQGAYMARWGERRVAELRAQLSRFPVVPIDRRIAELWAEVMHVHRRHQPISTPDAFVAATALALDALLVTNNASDFQDIPGLRVATESPPKAPKQPRKPRPRR